MIRTPTSDAEATRCRAVETSLPQKLAPVATAAEVISEDLNNGAEARPVESTAQLLLLDRAGISNETDEWYTPSWMFRSLDIEFDLDPCSPGAPPSSVPARSHLTKADNGLTAPWSGSVWLNPPFSSKRPWYERLVQHGDGIALMPARTETHDLQTYMQAAQALLFLRGRIYFERGHRPGGNGVGGVITTPPFGICLCAYGERMAIALLSSKLLGVRARVTP